MNYLLIDESDPGDIFECEGEVLKTFFSSTKIFNSKESLELIRKNNHIEQRLKKNDSNYFNIVQFSAHGNYTAKTRTNLEYSAIVKRRGTKDTEIFRPDSIVRTGLKTDIFFSTNCETFNSLFIDVIKHYKGVSNFIAPVNSPYIGNTLIFSMMFYNILLRRIRINATKITNENIIESFKLAKSSYKKYNSKEDFRLYNCKYDKVFK
ncbi:MAG: hypothetical protein H0W84_05090 [Bacteroidetes bacterium]|nr:hypothetical protein [Bacteroidota bacterium]